MRSERLPHDFASVVPPLRDRADELPKVVDEYALDAIAEFLAPPDCFTRADRSWVLEHAASSLDQLERPPCAS